MTGLAAYRAEVDGLRAVAVLLVVLFHAGVLWLPGGCVGGFVGVDVFFVVSGYLITQILKTETDRTGSLAAVMVAAFAFTPHTTFPGTAALLPVIGTMAILHSGKSISFLSWPLFTGLGKISYSFYLWHWPLFTVAAALWPGLGTSVRLLVVAAAVPIAATSMMLLEKPVRYSQWLARRKVISLGLAAAVAGLVLLAVGAARWQSNYAAESPTQKSIIAAGRDRTRLARSCFANGGDDQVLECSFGPPSALRTLVLFGDSHAEQLFPERKVRVNSAIL